jgi:hypothetical protein
MIYFKKKLRTSFLVFNLSNTLLLLKTEITANYFLGIHFTSSAFKSNDNFRAKTKR